LALDLMLPKSLILTIAALCLVVGRAQLLDVYVFPQSATAEGNQAGLDNLFENFWVTEVGMTAPKIYSSTNNTNHLSFHLNKGQTYTFHVAQPAFYHYSKDYIIEDVRNTLMMHLNFAMVPVYSGLTVVNLNDFNSRGQGGAYSNFTFPHGVFDFDHASLFSLGGTIPSVNFGSGVPPAQFYFGTTSRFSTLPAGTYLVYSEAHLYSQSTGPTQIVTANYSWVSAHYTIFAGEDAVTGLKGSYFSANRTESNWYIGDIVVTKPTSDCFQYDWAEVNTYSFSYGAFDETAHPVSSPLLTECFDLSSPSALECTDIIFNDTTPQSTCGAFGDPHIIKFDRTGVTCGNQTYVILAENNYFKIGAFADFVALNSTATYFTSIVFTYKLPCNPITVTFTSTANAILSDVNAPLAYRHALRLYGSNIYIDAIHLRFQVRQLWGANVGLTFGLSIPTSMVTTTTGVCSQSCPGYEENLSTKRGGLANSFASIAAAACDGLAFGTYEYDACVFDVGLTGNTDFAAAAVSFVQTKAEMETTWTVPAAPPSWPEPTPDTPPVSPPTTGNPPTSGPIANAPTGDSSVLAPTMFLLVIVIATILF